MSDQEPPVPARITIFDTTLRDGEQAPGFSMREAEKVRLARKLDALGVDVMEAGFPIASEDDFNSVRAVAREVRRPVVAALARSVDADIDRAAAALEGAARPRIHTFIATSDLHLEHKLRMSRAECLDHAAAAVRRARRHVDDVEFSAEDATRSDPDFLVAVVEAVVEAGATTVNLPDTVGYATPDEIARFFRTVRARVKGADRVVFSAHCHNDLGLAVANSLAALEGGCRQLECTVNGIGERAGNASLEEIVMTLRVRPDKLPFTTGIVDAGALLVEPAPRGDHGRRRPVEQGHRGPERLRARSRHPPGRHPQGPTDVRDHAARRTSASRRRRSSWASTPGATR